MFLKISTLVRRYSKWSNCLIYIEDVIKYSKSVDAGIIHVKEILSYLGAADVTWKIKKIQLCMNTTEYLVQVIKLG